MFKGMWVLEMGRDCVTYLLAMQDFAVWGALNCPVLSFGCFSRVLFWQTQMMFRKVVWPFSLVMLMWAWGVLYLFVSFEYVSFHDSQFSSCFCSILVNHLFGPFWSTFWFSEGFLSVVPLAPGVFLALLYRQWNVTPGVAMRELGQAGSAPWCYRRRFWCCVPLAAVWCPSPDRFIG